MSTTERVTVVINHLNIHGVITIDEGAVLLNVLPRTVDRMLYKCCLGGLPIYREKGGTWRLASHS